MGQPVIKESKNDTIFPLTPRQPLPGPGARAVPPTLLWEEWEELGKAGFVNGGPLEGERR